MRCMFDLPACRQYDQREAAYGAPPDQHTLWLWRDADWRKWERDEPWDWDASKRRYGLREAAASWCAVRRAACHMPS